MNPASMLSKAQIYDIFPDIHQRYELEGCGPIGDDSGFGAVWRAKDRWIGTTVAIKISDEELSDEVRICREATETVRTFDFYRSPQGWDAYAMEHLAYPWKTVSSHIATRRYKNKNIQHYFDTFEIMKGVLHGLTKLHGKPYQKTGKFIHADIKPANIFFYTKVRKRPHTVFRMPGFTEMVKLIDLGVGVEKGRDIVGYTQMYRPPGISIAEPGYDLYATAVSFIELLTGTPPSHDQMKHKARLRKHLQSYSSGSKYIDELALTFASKCKNATTQTATTASSLLRLLDEGLFNLEPLKLICVRALATGLRGEATKSTLIDVLYEPVASYWGWKRSSKKRKMLIGDYITALREDNLLQVGKTKRYYKIA
jgi:serine/threonine protein kinase